MNKFTLQTLLLLYFFAVSLCWWDLGHMVLSKIAQIKLKENHQGAYDSFNDLVKGFENLTDGRSNSFVEAAVWPDDIKANKANYFDDYHFTDIVYDPDFMFINMQQSQKDINSINVVGSCMNVLKTNKNSVTFQRAFMARYLLHLVGDIHQPLHSVSMFNATFKTGDLGGNLIKIQTQNYGEMNLHGFLDSVGTIQDPDEPLIRPLNQSGKAIIDSLANQIIQEFSEQSFGDLTNNLNPHSWAVESYNKAVSQVYSFVLKNKKTTPQWQQKIRNLCRERIALGGYRLANCISTIYK